MPEPVKCPKCERIVKVLHTCETCKKYACKPYEMCSDCMREHYKYGEQEHQQMVQEGQQ